MINLDNITNDDARFMRAMGGQSLTLEADTVVTLPSGRKVTGTELREWLRTDRVAGQTVHSIPPHWLEQMRRYEGDQVVTGVPAPDVRAGRPEPVRGKLRDDPLVAFVAGFTVGLLLLLLLLLLPLSG